MPESQCASFGGALAKAIGIYNGFTVRSLWGIDVVDVGQQGSQIDKHYRPRSMDATAFTTYTEAL